METFLFCFPLELIDDRPVDLVAEVLHSASDRNIYPLLVSNNVCTNFILPNKTEVEE